MSERKGKVHMQSFRGYAECGFALIQYTKRGPDLIWRFSSTSAHDWERVTCKNCLRHKPK